MEWFHKLKKYLEWYEHGRALAEIAVFTFLSLGGGGTVRALLLQFTKIPPYWITPIWLTLTGMILWICLRVAPHILKEKQGPVGSEHKKLTIHTALYGTGPDSDVSVASHLDTAVRDALVIPVDNNLVAGQPDPAPNRPKRLYVEYSYGSSPKQTVERPEARPGHPSRLVLPEDSEIHRRTVEVEQLREQIGTAKAPAAPTLAERTFALCKEIRVYLKEVGPEPHYEGSYSSNPDWAKWLSNVIMPWKNKFHAGYMLRFNDKVVRIRHELAEKGLRDGDIDSVINVDVHSEAMVKQMVEALITLGAKLDD